MLGRVLGIAWEGGVAMVWERNDVGDGLQMVVGSKRVTWQRMGPGFQIWAAERPKWVYMELFSISREAAMAELAGALPVLCLVLGSIHACCKIYILSNIVRTL